MSQVPRSTNTHQPTILVLSDSAFLFDLLQANLQPLPVRIQRVVPSGLPLSAPLNPDLIIVANSDSTTEPVVALAEAALASQIGRIPLLIISDRAFDPSPTRLIFHLDFPFNATMLRRQVQTLLANTNPLVSQAPNHDVPAQI